MMEDNRALFDYWHDRVQLRNLQLVASSGHVQTQNLRHDCTNYDELWKSSEVQRLEEPERSRVIAIIKYECTAKVLQRRSGILKDRVVELQAATQEVERQKSRLLSLISALQEKLFGKDRDIEQLQKRISLLEAENEGLRVQGENDKAYAELLQEFEQLKQRYAAVEKRKQELAKNNQSLGGRVAHTNRFKRERDEARTVIQELRQQIAIATQQNQQLLQENEALRSELKQLRQV
jgi:chromosome segregation ATPase